MTEPILPRSRSNPAGQTQLIRRTLSRVNAGLRKTETAALEWWGRQRYVVNRYEYLIDSNELRRFIAEITRLAYDATAQPMVDGAATGYQTGVAAESVNLAGMFDEYQRTIDTIIHEQGYQYRVGLVRARVFEEMAGFSGDLGTDLARVLTDGMQNGQGPLDVARAIRGRFDVSRSRAERIARTEILMANRRGKWDESDEAKKRLGLQTKMLHLSALSPTTRHWHAARHGETFTTDEVREWYAEGSNSINCYLPGTPVKGRFVAGSKAHYSGVAYNIVTAGGRNLRVTPNHPVMTDAGLVPAAKLNIGDNLICDIAENENPVGVSALDIKDANTTIEQVFGALSEFGHSFSRGVSGIDFHGDGRFINKNVDIVDADRVLVYGCDPSGFQRLDDLALKHAYFGSYFCSSGGLDLPRINSTTACFIGGLCDRLGVFFAGKLKSVVGAFASVSVIKSLRIKPSVKCDSRNPNFIADFKDRLPRHVFGMQGLNVKRASIEHCSGQPASSKSDAIGNTSDWLPAGVALDKVVNIEVFDYDGHVYDLQELSGLMIAGGIISSNCKCSQTSVPVDDNGQIRSKALRKKIAEQREAFGLSK